jgi:hypothetical protein
MARTSTRTKTNSADTVQGSKPKRSYTGPIIGVAVIAALVALVVLDPPPPGVEFASQGNVHLSAIEEPHPPYNSSPPSSGPHVGFLANWGPSEEPLPPELFIHNLEDGGIVLAYNCPDGCDDLASGLESIVTDVGAGTLSTPYEEPIVDPDGNEYRAAAVAWTRVFYFDELTPNVESEIETFISLYRGIDNHAGR